MAGSRLTRLPKLPHLSCFVEPGGAPPPLVEPWAGFTALKPGTSGFENSAGEIVGWGQEKWDPQNDFDPITGRYTPSDSTLIYWAMAGGGAHGNSFNDSQVHLRQNGSNLAISRGWQQGTDQKYPHLIAGASQVSSSDYFHVGFNFDEPDNAFFSAFGFTTTCAFRATRAAAAGVVGGVISGYSEAFDLGGDFDPITGVFVAPESGLYLEFASGFPATGMQDAGTWGIATFLGGVQNFVAQNSVSGSINDFGFSVGHCLLHSLAATDQLSLRQQSTLAGETAESVNFSVAKLPPSDHVFAARKTSATGIAGDVVTGWTENFDSGGDFNATTGVFVAARSRPHLVIVVAHESPAAINTEPAPEINLMHKPLGGAEAIYMRNYHRVGNNYDTISPHAMSFVVPLSAGDELYLKQITHPVGNCFFAVYEMDGPAIEPATITAGGPGLIALDVAPMAANQWVEIDLTDVTTLTISSHDALFSANTATVEMQLSSDGGISWYTTSGQYVENLEEDTFSSSNNRTAMRMLVGQTAAGYGPIHRWEFTLDCLGLACPKPFRSTDFLADPGGGSIDGAYRAGLFTVPVAINRARIRSTLAGTSGTIHIHREQRAQALTVLTGAQPAGTNIDVSGAGSAFILGTDIAMVSQPALAFSAVSGATIRNAAGDVLRSLEGGNTGTLELNQAIFVANASGLTGKGFMLHMQNLDVAAPSFGFGAELSSGASMWWGLSKYAEVHDALQLLEAVLSGSIYVVKDLTPNTLIAAIDVSAMGSDEVVDVQGYSRVNYSSFDALGAADVATTIVQNSDDGGVTYDGASGDYWFKYEHGSTELQEAGTMHPVAVSTDPITGLSPMPSVHFLAEFRGLGVAMPAFCRAASFMRAWKTHSIHLTAAEITHQKLTFSGAVAGASGTIYITGQ